MAKISWGMVRLFILFVISLRIESKVTYMEDLPVTAQRYSHTQSFNLNQDAGTGSTEDPHVIYYPFIGNCSDSPDTTLGADTQSLTLVSRPYKNAPCLENNQLSGTLSITISSSELGYLLGAMKISSTENFKVVELDKEVIISEQNIRKTISINLGRLCAEFPCSLPSDYTSVTSIDLLLFLAPNNSTYSSDNILNKEDHALQTGNVFRIHLSKKLPSPPSSVDTTPSPTAPHLKLFAGDSSAFIFYDQNNLTMQDQDIHAARVVIYPNPVALTLFYGCTQGNLFCNNPCGIGEVCETQRFLEAREKSSGEITLYNLTNDQNFHISLCLENKWGFCSSLPPSQTITPLELEKFLQKQSCFFFSASFGREHPVIQDLKWLRDRVLKQYSWGKKFVQLYYHYAPQYAKYVSQSPVLKTTIRSIGYLFSAAIQHLRNFMNLSIIKRWRDIVNGRTSNTEREHKTPKKVKSLPKSSKKSP